MSEPVNHRRVALAAGILTALYVVTSLLVREVPDALLALLGGPDGLDRRGGLRVHYKPPAGAVQLFDYPGVTADQVPDMIDVLVHGGLSMREGLESHFALRLGIPEAPRRGWDRDPSAVVLEFDQWRPEDGGDVHTVPYLLGPSREALERALATAQLPAGSMVGFERLDPVDGSRDQSTVWRTYELGDEVLIDGTMIAEAVKSYDPNTNRPLVLLDFTEAGADRFCEVTRRIVGNKLATILGDRVRSAPIINGAICGGRASITMGGSDPQAQDREADALASVLAHGALPVGGSIEQQQLVAPANSTPYEWAARLGLGGLIGAAVGLVTLLVLGFVRPHRQARPAAIEGAFPWRRLGVTLLAPLALIVGGMTGLPGVNQIELEHIVRGDPGDQFSVIALGILPILSSFAIVELVALAVPRWRWRRHDVRGRIGLGKAVAVVSVVVALVQGFFMYSYLESLSRGGAEIVDAPGLKTRLVVMGSVASATMLLGVVAGLIREHGLGNGYGALIASGSVLLVLGPLGYDPMEVVMTRSSVDLLAVATAVVIIAATACVLRWQITGAEREPALRVPTSGLSPVSDAGGLMVILVTLSAFGLGFALFDAYAWVLEVRSRLWVSLAILGVGVVAYSWLFARPRVVERVAMQAGLDRPSSQAWLRGTVVSAWLLFGVALAARFAVVEDGIHKALVDAIGLMVSTAVVLDLVADARARRQALAPAGVLHQIQYAGVVERVLADAGIPCHLHASHLRTLLAFFGPFAPAIVMVPEQHASAARAKVDDVLRAATSKPPVALLQEPPTRRLTWDAQTTAGR